MMPETQGARLFSSDQPLQPLFWAILVNRFQVDYFVLLLPGLIVAPQMIWLIIAAGLLAALQVYGIGRCLDACSIESVRMQLQKLCRKGWVRLLIIPAIVLLALKLTIAIKGYVEIVHQFLFPSVDIKVFISLMLLGSYYLAQGGMLAVLRFSLIAFLATLIILVVLAHFLFPPEANYHHMLPLFPQQGSAYPLKSLLALWPLYGGPEFLIVLYAWAGKKRLTPYLLAGHIMTLAEYLFIFVIALLFFGPNYLSKLQFPLIQMIRYVQLPFFERIEMFMIAVYMTSYLLISSILMLYLYGAVRIVLKRICKPATRRGLLFVYILTGIYLFVADTWFLSTEIEREVWERIQLVTGGFSFLLIPLVFAVLLRVRKKVAG